MYDNPMSDAPQQLGLFTKKRKPRGAKRPHGPTPLERARANPETEWCDDCHRIVERGYEAWESDSPWFGHLTCLLKRTALPPLEEIDRLNITEAENTKTAISDGFRAL